MQKKKIALVYDAIYPFVKGGGERRFYEIGIRLARHGNDVHLYGMKFWEGPDVIEKDGMTLHGLCKAIPLYTSDGKRSIKQTLIFGISCLKMVKENFDVIDCCGFPYFSLFSCKLACLFKRKKLFATWHEVWGLEYWKQYLGKLGYIGYMVERVAVQLPDTIISCAPEVAARLKEELHFNKTIVMAANGIDVDYIKEISPSDRKSDIIYAGRLMDFKNIDILLLAIEHLKKTKPDIHCLIIGDGPERPRLEKMVKELHLEMNVEFTGFLQEHDDVYSLMKSSKVFVLPSIREGFGIAVLEANTCGIPVVTTDHKNNSARQLINEGINGFLSELIPQNIANKIYDSLEKSFGQNAFSNYAEQYDWNYISTNLDSVYQQ